VLDGVHLTLLIGPTIPVPVPTSVVEALQSVQVTSAAGQRSGFQLSFALSPTSPLQVGLIPAGYFDPGTRVIIVATVNVVPTVLMDGVITRQEVSISSDLGQSRLTVTGEDISLMMDLSDVLPKPFIGMPQSAQIALIIGTYAQYGLVPLIIPPIFEDYPVPVDSWDTQHGTDLEYLNLMAEMNGYVFYVEPGPAPFMNLAYFGPPIRIGIPQPALNVGLDAMSNVDSLSFSMDGLSATQYVVIVQEPQTKLPIPIPVPDISLLSPPLAVRAAPQLRSKRLADIAQLDPVQAMAEALAEAMQAADAVSATGKLDVARYGGILRARGMVGVRGAGLAYDGIYYVKSVTHDIKAGEYMQSFTLTRNGLVSLTPAVMP
jgi:hypothetical protein